MTEFSQSVSEILEILGSVIDPDDITYANGIDVRNALDLIETIAERKPVYLMRGYADEFWNSVVLSHTNHFDLARFDSLPWERTNLTTEWPKEMLDHLRLPERNATCLTCSEDVHAELAQLGPFIEIETEARLLGYPVCCVAAYHMRHELLAKHVVAGYRQASHDDPDEMRRLIVNNEPVEIATEARIAFKNGFLSPYCSFAYCDHCAQHKRAPGPRINRERAGFARDFARDEVAMLRRMYKDAPRDGYTWQKTYGHLRSCSVQWSDVDGLFFRYE